MKNGRKIAALCLCALLLVGASVAGTMAYLSAGAQVENTFTVGTVDLTLDEGEVGDDGSFTDAGVTRGSGYKYKMVPDRTYDKDPTVHMDASSEDCWLFVKVYNGIADVEAADNTIENQIVNTYSWTKLTGSPDPAPLSGETIYYKTLSAAEISADQDYEVFDSFKISKDADQADLELLNSETITVTAYAIQEADDFLLSGGNAAALAAWKQVGGLSIP